MKKIFHIIINFLKMILLYIINFFLSLFPNHNKKTIIKNKEKINTIKKENDNKKTNFESSNHLPDDNSKIELSNNYIYTEYQLLLISLIDEVIDKTIEEKGNIKISKMDYKTKDNIKKLKEKITPPIIEEIATNKISNNDSLKQKINISIEIELKKEPIIPKDNKDKNKESNLPSKEESHTNTDIIYTNKKEKSKIPESKENKIELKDDITKIITSSTIVLANITREVLNDKHSKESPISEPKPTNSSSIDNNNNIQNDIQPTIETTLTDTIIVDDNSLISDQETNSLTNNVFPKENNDLTTNSYNNFIENPSIKIPVIITPSTDNQETLNKNKLNDELDNNQEEIIIELKEKSINNKPLINLTPIEQETKKIISSSSKEIEKNELEDKNYDYLEEQINRMLNQITNFIIKYDNRLTKEQKTKLNNELNNLRTTKERILVQKENDIKEEEYNLTQFIMNEEIIGLKKELTKQDLEHQNDLNEYKLKNIEELDNLQKKEAAIIEKKILKKKLRRTSKTLAITSLLALPFIRNKYFFYFTIGCLVNYQFNIIDNFIHRKSLNQVPNLPDLKKGQDALYEAINNTNNNIIYLNNLEQEILEKYPDLQHDNEYLVYISSLKKQLLKTATKLHKKQEILDKYCHKNIRYKKILKKEK